MKKKNFFFINNSKINLLISEKKKILRKFFNLNKNSFKFLIDFKFFFFNFFINKLFLNMDQIIL
jgi:hypothetical protein